MNLIFDPIVGEHRSTVAVQNSASWYLTYQTLEDAYLFDFVQWSESIEWEEKVGVASIQGNLYNLYHSL